jgi:hypothetical protein
MRALIQKTITKEEAEILMAKKNEINFEHPIVKKILNKCIKLIGKQSPISPSIVRIEAGENGHDWHIDTGTHSHMSWCKYGLSTLLSIPKSGGLFKYKKPELSYTPKQHYLSTIVHSSDECHMVEPSKQRTVCTIFLS